MSYFFQWHSIFILSTTGIIMHVEYKMEAITYNNQHSSSQLLSIHTHTLTHTLKSSKWIRGCHNEILTGAVLDTGHSGATDRNIAHSPVPLRKAMFLEDRLCCASRGETNIVLFHALSVTSLKSSSKISLFLNRRLSTT